MKVLIRILLNMFAFSALMLLVGWLAGLELWGAGMVAYGPADATATHCLLLQ